MSAPLPNAPASPAREQPPLVYLSYSHKDEVWLDKLLVWLKPMEAMGQIRVFYDRALAAGVDWNEALQANLQNAALGIALLSPDWLAGRYTVEVELPALSSRPLIPVLVRDCNWQPHPEISRRQILSADGKPLSAVRRPRQDQAFRSLVEAVRAMLGIGSQSNLSREAQQILDLAAQFARSRPDRLPIDVTCLVYAFLERGQREPTPVKSSQFLWNAVPEAGRSRYPDLRRRRFPLFPSPGEAPPPESKDLRALDRASVLSGNTLASGPIHARHLLAAVLVDPDAEPALAELELDLPAFRNAFLDFVLKTFPDEPAEYWGTFLANEPEQDEGNIGPREHPRAIAGFQSEDWTGRDLLNIRRDVDALSSLVAGWNVQPPLSIGLFGEWGSGKSFFMRQMRKRVTRLALAAQASGRPQRECAYYKNIAQIEFNAWHYMEGDNLWACLVEHIFSNLGLPQDTTDTQLENRRKQILEQIGAKKNLEEQAAHRRAELEAKRAEAAKKAEKAQTELNAAETALKQEQSALWGRIKAQLSDEVERILQSIPETARLRDSVETVRQFTQEAQTLGGRVSLLWKLFRHDPQRRKILYWMLGGSALTFVLLRLVQFVAPDLKLLLQPAVQTLLAVASGLVATAGKFRPVLSRIGQAVAYFEKRNREISDAVARAEEAQRQQIAKLENDVKTLSQSIGEATKEQQEHRDAITALENELATTDANRLLGEFIKSRADADDYRKHLGMVALVRRDFERLSDFFRLQREDEKGGRERPDSNTVNRIILYVDDLDRCPPQAVVSVLQAIHLLLAFPIFVVVVAVDSRWVSRSLERCYDWLVPATPVPQVERDGAERRRAGAGATAHDYLEKIFQIPFWIAPMDSTACQFMIRGLAQAASTEQARLRESIARATQKQPLAKMEAAAASGDGGTPAPMPLQAGAAPPPEPPPPAAQQVVTEAASLVDPAETEESEPVDLAPRHLDVDEPELKKIDELTVLIGRSPRVAKRFLNCYRLIKARLDESELEKFLADRFQDVMEVLAIVVGAPSISREVLCAMAIEDPGLAGDALVGRLTKTLGASAMSTAEGAEVVRLLASASASHLKDLRSVIPLVSRFSFATQSETSVGSRMPPRKKREPVPASKPAGSRGTWPQKPRQP